MDYKYGDITEKIIGASFRVHGTLHNGLQEVIYQRALEFHRLTHKKYNPAAIQHPIKSKTSY